MNLQVIHFFRRFLVVSTPDCAFQRMVYYQKRLGKPLTLLP
jgi:hypothetical protein